MNSYGKKLMGIALIAALSSGITIGAFSILNKSADSKTRSIARQWICTADSLYKSNQSTGC